MNRLEALRIFCAAAETQNFRQTALALSLSPQAVSRAILFLEQEFGELLFIRNTRSTQITPFGEQVYADAKMALAQTTDLFQKFNRSQRIEMSGMVRVDVPKLGDFLLPEVLVRLADYPEIVLDWCSRNERSHADRSQIDVGIRVGAVQQGDFIVKNITHLQLVLVAAPSFLTQFGQPENLVDMQLRFPVIGHRNANDGTIFSWDFADGSEWIPPNPAFIGDEQDIILAAARAGRGIAQVAAWAVGEDLRSGSLKTVLPEQTVVLPEWQMYVYRPKRHIQTARVKKVFEILVEVLQERFQAA